MSSDRDIQIGGAPHPTIRLSIINSILRVLNSIVREGKLFAKYIGLYHVWYAGMRVGGEQLSRGDRSERICESPYDFPPALLISHDRGTAEASDLGRKTKLCG